MSSAPNRILSSVAANLRASPLKSAILFIGAGVLVFLVIRQVSGGAEKVEAGIEWVVAPAANKGEGMETAQALPTRPKRCPMPRVSQTLLRNPFAGAWMGPLEMDVAGIDENDTETESEELALQFTMSGVDGGMSAVAVISGVIVYPGSKVAGYEVVSIGTRHVVLRNGMKEITLRMP